MFVWLGFRCQGYITSDCDADADVYRSHHYYATPEETVAGVLKAGTDVDCTSFVGQHAQSALAKGLIDEALIDKRPVNQIIQCISVRSRGGVSRGRQPATFWLC